MTFKQKLLALKAEYHWWRIRSLEKRKNNASEKLKKRLTVSQNLHRYKAERATIEYEISEGLRNINGLWI